MFIVLSSHGGLRASGFSQRLVLTHDTDGEYRLIGKALRCQLSHWDRAGDSLRRCSRAK